MPRHGVKWLQCLGETERGPLPHPTTRPYHMRKAPVVWGLSCVACEGVRPYPLLTLRSLHARKRPHNDLGEGSDFRAFMTSWIRRSRWALSVLYASCRSLIGGC